MKKKNILSKANLIIIAIFILASIVSVSGEVAQAQYGGGGGYTPPAVNHTISNKSVVINSGDASTASTAVTLIISADYATSMAISNNADFSGGIWETYAASKSWTLTSGEGTKNVYVKFKDASGVSSAPVFDTIILNKNASAPDNSGNSSNTLASYPDGTLIKVAGEPEVYVIKNGNKIWITSPEEFEKAGYKWSDIKEVSGETLKSVGSVTLIRVEGDSKVYVVQNNVRRHIKSPEEFNAAGYKWDQIVAIKQSEADAYAEEGSNGIVEVTFAWLRVRASNTVKSAQLSMVHEGNTFSILEEKNGWYKITTADGITGWISGAYAKKK